VSPKEKSVASLPYYQGTGRRKTSIARVRLVAGEGQIVINGRTYEQHFGGAVPQSEVFAPYRVTGTEGRFTTMVKVQFATAFHAHSSPPIQRRIDFRSDRPDS
jgi:ribosomal protein S9